MKKRTKAKRPKAGRPSKFKPEYCDELGRFFAIEPYVKEAVETSKEFYKDGTVKKVSEKLRLIPNRLPTLFGFAKHISVDYTTVYRWAQKGEEDAIFGAFCKAYKEAKELQKEFLIAIGLAGAAPPASFIFTAKNVTDMRDKQEVDTTKTFDVTGLEKLSDEDLDALIKGLQNQNRGSAPRAGAEGSRESA